MLVYIIQNNVPSKGARKVKMVRKNDDNTYDYLLTDNKWYSEKECVKKYEKKAPKIVKIRQKPILRFL
jgi:hypothetical protein